MCGLPRPVTKEERRPTHVADPAQDGLVRPIGVEKMTHALLVHGMAVVRTDALHRLLLVTFEFLVFILGDGNEATAELGVGIEVLDVSRCRDVNDARRDPRVPLLLEMHAKGGKLGVLCRHDSFEVVLKVG